jgi:alkylation response protein AidB-like acyl-CoA dehydrogenase
MESMFSDLSEEELEWKVEIEEYLKNNLGPYVDDIEQGKVDIWDIIRPMGKKGYVGITFPKRFGGLGGTFMKELLFSEAVCYHSLPVDMSRGASSYPAMLIRTFGKTKSLRKYIDPLCKGEKIGCFCFTEPDAGSDLSRMKTIAKYDKASEEYILNGEKRFITNGSVADILIVYARNGAFIVQSDCEGYEVIEEYSMMGLHGLHLGHMKFNNVRIPKENALFYKEIKEEPGKKRLGKTAAIASMQNFLGPERAVISVEALGVAKRALEVAIQYTRERVQFKRPISEFEGISFKIAEMMTFYEAARALVNKSVRNIGDGDLAAMAKLFSCQTAYKICDEALQCLGGIGYTNKYPVERCLRDVRLLRIGGGTDEVMKYVIQKGIYRKIGKQEVIADIPKFVSISAQESQEQEE